MLETFDTHEHKMILLSRERTGTEYIEMIFRVSDAFNYQPGQYIWIDLDLLTQTDPCGSRRAFSLTSYPKKRNNEMSILFREGTSVFKQTLQTIAIGTTMRLIGPFGSALCLPTTLSSPLVLISAGVGIAPFLSLLRQQSSLGNSSQLHLIHYDTSENALPYFEELSKWQKEENAAIHFRNFTSEDLKNCIQIPSGLYYISGPQAFINEVYQVLTSNGIQDDAIHFEWSHPISPDEQIDTQLISEIQEKNTIFQQVLNDSSNHIVVTSKNGHIIYANKAAEENTGFSFEEMRNQTPRLWGAVMSPEYYQELWKTIKQGKPFIREITNRKKDGTLYYCINHISPIHRNGDNDVIIGYLSTEENITEIVRTKQKLEQLRTDFITSSTTAKLATWEWDVRIDKIIDQNGYMEELFGINFTDSLQESSKLWASILCPDSKEKSLQELNKILSSKDKTSDFSFCILDKNKEVKTIRSIAKIERDKQAKPLRLIGISWDVSDLKKQEQLGREFVSLASHQLRTPITEISWLITYLLKETSKLKSDQRETLEQVNEAAHTMALLITALLDITRIESGKVLPQPKQTNLNLLVTNALTDHETEIQSKSLQIILSQHPNLELMKVDPVLIQQVYANLLSNAIRYSADQSVIEIAISRKNNMILSRITDSGCGIPKKEQEQIFQKFFRATNAMNMVRNGTGLGLYLTKMIVESSGGNIWFESKENEGTTFWFTLPYIT